MSDKKPKPGKDSGVTSDDMAKSDDIGKMAPGKTNLVQPAETGNAWIDRGAVCAGHGGDAVGCIFEGEKQDEVRARLVVDFKDRVSIASTNYKLALLELKVEELMKKEEDLSWVLSLALDLAGMFIIGAAVNALLKYKGGAIRQLEQLALDAATHGQYDRGAISERVTSALSQVSSETIKTQVKAAGAFATKKAKSVAKDATSDSQKSLVIAFIDQLRDGCDLAYLEFSDYASGHSNDAELVVLWEGMHPGNHQVGTYKAALGEKLARFKQSGVTKIGRSRDERGYDSKILDRQVVWMKHRDGTKTLFYKNHETGDNPETYRRGEPGTADMYPDHKMTYGELGRAQAKLGGQVPSEFWNEAVAINEAKWGEVKTIEDPFTKVAVMGGDYKKRMDAARVKPPAPPAIGADPVRTDVKYSPDDFSRDMGKQLGGHK